ncbi:MAG: hypothetical protein JEY91_04365 [Spirochaetaceae bacterium]|nr:hypothetical protein [Spirochaetaceae bacterium]
MILNIQTGSTFKFLFFLLFLNFIGNWGVFLYSDTNQREKVAIIIPGRGEYPEDWAYQEIKESFETEGYTSYIVHLDWENITADNLVSRGNEALYPLLQRNSQSDITLLGFSFGAVIALKNSHHENVKRILLASLSPIFKEDLPYHLKLFQFFAGKLTDYDINDLSYPEYENRAIVFFYGTHDSLLINKKIREMRSKRFLYSEQILIKNAGHDISGRNYLAAIKNYISKE